MNQTGRFFSCATSKLACVLLWAALLGWFFVDVGNRAVVSSDSIHRTDLTVYTEAGAAFYDGREPYEVTNPRGWHYLYPPMFALAIAPLSSLPEFWQAFVWFVFSVGLVFACSKECRRLLRIVIPDDSKAVHFRKWIGLAVWLTALLPVLNTLQRGQVGIAVLYPLLLGARLVFESRSAFSQVTGGLVLSIPVVLKLTPLMPAGFIVLQQLWQVKSQSKTMARRIEWRRFLQLSSGMAGGVVLLVFLLPSALIGPTRNVNQLQTWVNRVVSPDDAGAVNDFQADSPRNQSLKNSTAMLFGHDRRIAAATSIIRVSLCVALLFFGLRIGQKSMAARMAAFGLSCGMTVMVSPLSWGHHFTVLVPGVLLVAAWLVSVNHSRMAILLAFAPALLCCLHWSLLEEAGRIGLLGMGTAIWHIAALRCFARLRAANKAGLNSTIRMSPLPTPRRNSRRAA